MPPRLTSVPASKLRPNAAHVQLLKTGVALQRQRRFIEAERCYQSVLRESPRNSDALNLLGTLALEAKRPDEAVRLFGAALKEMPRQPAYLNNLASGMIALKQVGKAEDALKRALRIDPNFVDALCNLGHLSKLLNRAQEAAECYARAVQLAPGSIKALLGLADVLVDTGDLEPAETLYRKILINDPRNVEAYVGLAMVHKFVPGDPEPERMVDLAVGKQVDERQLPVLHHATGKALADLKQFGAAFEQFAAAKQLRSREFDLAAYRTRHDTIIAGLDITFFRDRSAFGVDTEQPVFIVGMPRSGTTLTEQICSSHSEVNGAGELGILGEIASELGAREDDPSVFIGLMARMTAGQSRDIARIYLEQLHRLGGNARYITDKMPHNFEYLGLVQLLFPRARVIHCQRNPIDTCVSCFTHHFNEAHGYNTDLATLGLYYHEYRRIMAHWQTALPLRMFHSSYEALISEQEPRSRALLDFLGLGWEPACLAFHTNERMVRTPSRWQVRQPIYASSVKQWKRYEPYLGPLMDALGDLAVR